MGPIIEIARRRGLHVIEDAAQAHGAEYCGARAGSCGDIACFSFYPGKNLGAYGEAGAVVSKDASLIKTVRLQRDWGQEIKYRHALKGFNYRMEGLQGAVLGVKLKYLEAWTEARRKTAKLYDERLRGKLPIPVEPGGFRHVYHVYAVRVDDRTSVQKKFDEAGIAHGIHYPIPVHLQPSFATLGYRAGDFPCAEQAGKEFLSLPIFPEMSESQVDEVCRVLLETI
jgi:dTDP-4-amino-4,6-dideoxygalactose transaminase